ncbi:hypothetical protein BH18VER1_BH18VER1_14420 [soil metagenome]
MVETKEGAGEKRTVVRGADGVLYLMTETRPPIKLTEDDAVKLKGIMEDAEKELFDRISREMPALGGCVHVVIAEVFP